MADRIGNAILAQMSAHALDAAENDTYYEVAPRAFLELVAELRQHRDREHSAWIPCSKRMPENRNEVDFVAHGQLCCGFRRETMPHGNYFTPAWIDLTDRGSDSTHPRTYTDSEVSHWRHRPPPPEPTP